MNNFLRLSFLTIAFLAFTSTGYCASKPGSLIPATQDLSPDYFCSWNIQGYYSSYASSQAQKEAIAEAPMFGDGKYQNWLGQYPAVRQDLIFVMDEGWDLSKEDVSIVPERFPTYAMASQPASFKSLSDAVKKRGWRGLGLWMRSDRRTDDFWSERLNWMSDSGVLYWKVDYGNQGGDEQWRRHLTELGRQLDPSLTIETAMTPQDIVWGDTYRTYDVNAVMSIPQTLLRVVRELQFTAVAPAKGLINCEDEVYLGAALGCCYGVMRHSYSGTLPNGRQDFVFPPITRDLTHRMDEVVRAVRWHRIAPAFAVGTNLTTVSSDQVTDNWFFGKDEAWDVGEGGTLSVVAPAAVARGLPLPSLSLAYGSIKPYVVASRNPNGAVAIATLGRTVCSSSADRRWLTGECADVTQNVGQYSGPIGIFGRYHSLTLIFGTPIKNELILAQDLAGNTPEDITRKVRVSGSTLIIPGALIDRIGLSSATTGDVSEPGLVMVIRSR